MVGWFALRLGEREVAEAEHEIVLQMETAEGGFRCLGFSGVPAARRSWISIVSSGSDTGRRLVGDLAAELEAVLLGSSPQITRVELNSCPAPADMAPSAQSDRLKLLVLVGSNDCQFQDQRWYETWGSDDDQSRMMVVPQPGKYEDQFDPTIGDEHLLRRINASTWKNTIAEVLPSVLARAEITSSISRVFISYRRLETLPAALQLFDRLVHEGFDVFLDRFSIPPGYDFQRRLSQQLQDKSMVVLLESKSLRVSKWTQHEIDFAKRHRLGMLALQMPDVKDDAALASIAPDARERLTAADFVGPPRSVADPSGSGSVDEWPELTTEAIRRVVARVKTSHAQALFRRRHRLRGDVIAALNAENGVKATGGAVGAMRVICGSQEHIIWLTTRPPEVDDFRSLHGAHLARTSPTPGSRAIIVGPQSAVEPDGQSRLRWLREVSQCLLFDEGKLQDFARRLAKGDWP